MERLNLLAVALGLAALAGINLYLTVFVSGLAIHFHWITLAPDYQSLGVLGNPWIITIAGVLYFLEFCADKIPWIDSIWDAVHTVIRPIGGALLTAKAATRLASNTSPEPFSNIALSVGEDLAVFSGLALIHYNPVIALSIFAVAIAAFLYFASKILRAMKAKIWLAWKKLNSPADFDLPPKLPIVLPSRLVDVFRRQNILGETTAWAVPCISGRSRGIPPNLFGALAAMNEEPHKLLFVALKGRRPIVQTIELDGMAAAREPKFLSENLIIAPASGRGVRYLFLFPRSSAAEVNQIVEYLREHLGQHGPTGLESSLEPTATI